MKIKVLDFKRSYNCSTIADIKLDIQDDEGDTIVIWNGKYKVSNVKGKQTYIITNNLDKEMHFCLSIDWNDISDDVESRLIDFDLEYNIDIK